MKQLKFMLAAATAISLATAAQAAAQLEKTEISSEHFDAENITLNNTAAVLDLGFTYEGATAADNESVVVAGGADNTANALQVNTGTDPLLRKIDPTTGNAVALDATKKVYIDTMVQFTVTPEGDTVTAGDNDKLMIYLKEVPEVKAEDGTVTAPASTKLMVKALMYRASYFDEDLGEEVAGTANKVDVGVTYEDGTVPAVTAGEWYSLKVEALLVNGVPMFTIKLGDNLLKPAETLNLADPESAYFPSLLGAEATSLDKVGFAGEGKVDELVFSKDVEQETSVDFTFAITCGEGVSAVAWTIDGVAQESLSATVTAGQTIAITDVTYADWYVASGTYVKDWSAEASEDLTAITVSATKTAAVVDGKIEVTESTKPADVGITTGSFAADTTPVAELNKVLTWATAKAGAAASAAGALVGQLDFTDETETPAEQAYLLNCNPNNADELKAAKDNFKFEASDLTKLFDVDNTDALSFDSKNYNGTVILEGKGELSGEWEVKAVGHKFFRARLVK